MRPPRALAARGALLGASGGVAAGLVDFAVASVRASTFLPVGRWKLAVFLCTLYGAAGATALALVGLAFGLILWASDGGAVWRAAFKNEESDGARWVAYALAAAAMLAGVGVVLQPIALWALRFFHHRALIAALVGAAGAGLVIPVALLTLVVAAALSPIVRIGPRARIKFVAPIGLEAAIWILGLYVGAAALAALVWQLEGRPRMPPAMKALNVAIWGPVVLGACVLGSHLIGRKLPLRERPLATPRGALVAISFAFAVPLATVLAAEWQLVRQLDLRPFRALALGLGTAVTLLWLDLGSQLRRRPIALRAAIAVVTPALLLALALVVGRHDRVRKAAVAFTGATGPIVGALQTATDLDRDGYSSILGGGDCDDWNREVHPGAFDYPDDGLDQDCNGHQATAQPPARPPFAALPPSVPRDLNVVVITVDALRADHVGAYGYKRPTTPRLDAVAADATLFTDAWAHAPSTRYSVPAILSGRYPSTIATALTHWPPAVLPENRLFAEILKDRGYRTAAFLSYYYFERGWGLDQGFDEYDYHLQTLHSGAGVAPSKTSGSSARQLADEVVDWIGRHRSEKFFLWTHFYDTHFDFERHPDMPASNFGASEVDLYDGEIRFSDFHIGRVIDALRSAGLWDKTILVITSDHGDGFGEHGIPPDKRHGYHLYANETKVPLIVRVPGLAPRKVATPAAHIDILPTVLNAIGGKVDDEPSLLGTSRLGLIAGTTPDDKSGAIFQEVTYEGPSSPYTGTQRRAVVTHDWHLIRNVVPDGTRELYRRADDPDEEHDVSGTGEADENALTASLAAWMDQIALPTDFARRATGNVQAQPFAPGRALGDSLGGMLIVDGVDAPGAPIKSGSAFDVSIYLHAAQPIPPGWRLFTHVVSGGRMINADHEPVEGTLPLQRMRTGSFVRDRIHVTVPRDWPAGPTQIRLGLWRGPERAKAAGAHAAPDDAVDLATLIVTP
ncbi:MAG: sulfatase [Myxococcales bacterium]|nr:sulfatase [Myxococcales bacterium]